MNKENSMLLRSHGSFKRKISFLALFAVFVFMGSLPLMGSAWAQSFSQDAKIDTTPEPQEENEKTDQKNSEKKDSEKEVALVTPVTEWIDAENALIKDLSAGEQETFFIIRNKHSVIRSLRIVRDDISNAVSACGKENPEIKDEMTERFTDWKGAVEPILAEADKFLKKEIRTQEVVPSKEFRNILKMNDKAYEFTNSKIEKRPVTELKACQKLLTSMDRTENELIALLQNILLPEEVVRERLEQQRKQEAADNKKDS